MTLQQKAEALEKKIQHHKIQQQNIEIKMVQQLHRALKSHQGFLLPFPTLMGGLMEVMEQAKANSHQAEVWNISGGKFLRKRTKQQSKIIPSKNIPAVSTPSTAMEKSHD